MAQPSKQSTPSDGGSTKDGLLYRGRQDYFGSVDFGPRSNTFHNAFTLMFHFATLGTALLKSDPAFCTFISVAPLTLAILSMLRPGGPQKNDHKELAIGSLFSRLVYAQFVMSLAVVAFPFNELHPLLHGFLMLVFFSSYWAYWTWLRHKAVVIKRPEPRGPRAKDQDSETPAISRPQIHNLMVLQGSGGHTTEMLSMLRAYTKFDNIAYRIHVVTQGDSSSRKQILDFEDWRASQRSRISGAYDIHTIPRARMVGQSWLTTPFTMLGSLRGIWDALRFSLPLSSAASGRIQYPDAILMNGPGTAFVVAALVHTMKLLSIIPLNRAYVVYVESFTRVDSLSLTGKLLWWCDLADIFITQHKSVAARYGLLCETNFSARNFD